MDMMVVPKPVFKASKEVEGYYLSFQMGNALIGQALSASINNRADSPFFEFINKIGLEVLTTNKVIFVPVSDIVLATNLETVCKVGRSLVALLLDRNNALSDQTLQRVKRFKELGFRIAFYNVPDIHALDSFLPYADYVFANHEAADIMPVLSHLRSSGYPAKVVASNINTSEAFQRSVQYRVEFFEGLFYTTPTLNEGNRVTPLQVNYLQLLNQVGSDDFDFDKFTKIVQRDTSLAIQFLKMVNSSSVRQEIKSLRHAAALVGQNEIKRWVTTAVTSSLSQEKPGEITRMSLLRAKFCENVAGFFDMGVHKNNLFLMGLFSVLDVILEMPIDKALEMIIVPDTVKSALLGEQNDFGMIYNFIKLYEQGNWNEVSRYALIKNIAVRDIFKAYNEALTWYGHLINMEIENEDEGEE